MAEGRDYDSRPKLAMIADADHAIIDERAVDIEIAVIPEMDMPTIRKIEGRRNPSEGLTPKDLFHEAVTMEQAKR